jgi:hypothetical protein
LVFAGCDFAPTRKQNIPSNRAHLRPEFASPLDLRRQMFGAAPVFL